MTTEDPGFDLSPRPVTRARRRPAWLPTAVVAAIAAAIAVLIWVLITNSQAFLEADLAVEEREDQGDRRFQLLGSPIQDGDQVKELTVTVGTVTYSPFTVVFDGVKVDVLSQQIPPDLFNCGIPVVLEGQWVTDPAPQGVSWPVGANDGWYFETDRILVKHDNDYTEGRIVDAAERGRLSPEELEAIDALTCAT